MSISRVRSAANIEATIKLLNAITLQRKLRCRTGMVYTRRIRIPSTSSTDMNLPADVIGSPVR
jgi:hypothetical protein